MAGVVDFAPVARVDELRVAAARARSRCAFTLTLAEFCGNTGLLQRTISVASTHDLQSVYLVLHPKMLGPVKARAAVTASWSIGELGLSGSVFFLAVNVNAKRRVTRGCVLLSSLRGRRDARNEVRMSRMIGLLTAAAIVAGHVHSAPRLTLTRSAACPLAPATRRVRRR